MPESLEESARIDGAGNMRILIRIVIPLSMPAIATIALFYAVSLWNDYFSALMYISKKDKMPLQLFLRSVVFESFMDETKKSQQSKDRLMNVAPETVRSATILVSTLPIIMSIPFCRNTL